ncbi:hypothetical protein [Bradyrhizobium sp. S3.9.1]|uniref:hypothetical protein n=1 Tax=Bradyrhizobium sp. S3.9.1 TaxID=3156431 RepID=UPI003398154D
MTWADVLPYIKGLGGPLLGFIFGSLLTSYVQWGFEKKKQILLRRRELVTGWRLALIPMIGQPQNPPMVWAGERQRAVMSSPYYASLRPHLSTNAIEKIEDPMIKIFVHVDRTKKLTHDWNHHFPLKVFIDEIDRIEKEWKLV